MPRSFGHPFGIALKVNEPIEVDGKLAKRLGEHFPNEVFQVTADGDLRPFVIAKKKDKPKGAPQPQSGVRGVAEDQEQPGEPVPSTTPEVPNEAPKSEAKSPEGDKAR